jgi:cation diffusion facilitator family transporter
MTQNTRTISIKQTLMLVLVLNWAVAGAKILYGLVTNFESMTADGFHSLADGASNIIGLIGITMASQPADKDHPYGHKKYETLFSLIIAGLLFFVSFNLITEGMKRFTRHTLPQVDLASFLVMVITMVVNFLVMKYEFRAGKRLNSDILISDSMHTVSDMFTSFSVIAAIIAVKLGYPILDSVITMLIAVFIAYAGFFIIKQSSKVLCDTVAVFDDKKIEELVLSIPGVENCHKIRTRGREDDIYVDLHAQVRPDMPIKDAHDISFKIEEAIRKHIAGVVDVVVHMEPKRKNR